MNGWMDACDCVAVFAVIHMYVVFNCLILGMYFFIIHTTELLLSYTTLIAHHMFNNYSNILNILMNLII